MKKSMALFVWGAVNLGMLPAEGGETSEQGQKSIHLLTLSAESLPSWRQRHLISHS